MEENKIVAKVNEREISQQDVMKFLNDLGPQVAMQFQSEDGIKKVIEELVNQELLFIDAKEENLEEEEAFKSILEQNKNILLKNYALNKLIQNEDANEEELKKYYEEHKSYFQKPKSAKASHILVKTEEEAKDALEKINNGMTFEDAAKEYSTCPSKERGGDLGEFTQGQMVPEFEEAVFSMDEGAISEPVKSQFGYHIIKLDHRSEAIEKAFEDVKDEVYKQVLGLKQQEKYLTKINELKSKNEVEIF
jgi:peptidyl-prolyl cis-trans isomerase C